MRKLGSLLTGLKLWQKPRRILSKNEPDVAFTKAIIAPFI